MGTRTNEMLHGGSFATSADAHIKIFDIIESYHNHYRKPSSLNNLTPAQFETNTKTKNELNRGPENRGSSNVQAHPPLVARVHVERRAEVIITENHVNRAAIGGWIERLVMLLYSLIEGRCLLKEGQ